MNSCNKVFFGVFKINTSLIKTIDLVNTTGYLDDGKGTRLQLTHVQYDITITLFGENGSFGEEITAKGIRKETVEIVLDSLVGDDYSKVYIR